VTSPPLFTTLDHHSSPPLFTTSLHHRFASYFSNFFTLFLIVALFGASCYELGHRPGSAAEHGWIKVLLIDCTSTAGSRYY
jgi:hypothetical protein